MTTPWTPKRLPGKNRFVTIVLRAGGFVADIWTEGTGAEGWSPYQLAGGSGWPPTCEAITFPGMNGQNIVTTGPVPEFMSYVHRMGMGLAGGLESRPGYLSGRFTITQALCLAVHLGASRVELRGTEHVSPRAFRNLETMVRPLKHRRVDVWAPEGNTPFNKEPRTCA